MNRTYRSLARECHVQATLTGDETTRQELERMAREYIDLAEWLELHPAPPQAEASPAQDESPAITIAKRLFESRNS